MRVNGLELNVRIVGEGYPFIWGHGLMGSMAMEDAMPVFDWEHLAEGERMIRYDARGHGRSEASANLDDYSWANLGRDMLALADALHIERFIAGGQSMGSATALCAALAAPERIKALVLVNPPTAWETRAAQGAGYEQMAALISRKGIAGLVEAMQSQAPTPPWLWEWMAQTGAGGDLAGAFGALDTSTLPLVLRGAAQTNLPPREELRGLAMPTLILAWTDDPGHPISTAESVAELLPNARLTSASNMDELLRWPSLIREFVEQQISQA